MLLESRAACCAALLALAAAAAATSQDFEFDDAPAEGAGERRPRNYVYDPHSPLCGALQCRKREVCVLRDAATALCATKKDILRKGDVIVAASSGGAGYGAGNDAVGNDVAGNEGDDGGSDDDDVFYDGDEIPAHPAPDRCVGCGSSARGGFLCGSDNRTYSSPCRLALHNCVRRPAAAVRAACRGFCPCRARHDTPRHDTPRRAPDCSAERMADRLLDWFGVLQAAAREPAPPARTFPPACKAEVRWMFAHLDADGDGRLSARELYALRHDERERCLRPFLAACGAEGAGAGVSRAAWCGCLRRAARACAALARAARARGGWAPACDARGLYRPRQCHAALAVCWCVDAHGRELPHSRTKGEPRCPPHRAPAPAPAPPDTDDEDGVGSGDSAPDSRY